MAVRQGVYLKFGGGAVFTMEQDGDGRFLMTLQVVEDGTETTIITDTEDARAVATTIGQFIDEHGS